MKTTQQSLLDLKKEELKQQANQFKEALTVDVEEIREKSEEIGKKALVIGSVLLAGYLITRLITPSSKRKENETEGKRKSVARASITDDVSRAIVKQITLFLLGLAKKKLNHFFNENTNFFGGFPSADQNDESTPTNQENF